MQIDDIFDDYAELLSAFHYSKSRTRKILVEMFDKCNNKLNMPNKESSVCTFKQKKFHINYGKCAKCNNYKHNHLPANG